MEVPEPVSEPITPDQAGHPSQPNSNAPTEEDGLDMDINTALSDEELNDLRSKFISAIETANLLLVEELLGHKGAIDLRLDYKFPGDDEENTGLTLLMLAAGLGQDAIVNYLLDEKKVRVDRTASFPEGCTALHMAAWGGYEIITRKLLNSSANPDSTTNHGRTPLNYACQKGHLGVAQMLIGKKADVNSKTDDWTTPLHCACSFGYREVAQMLIEKGANINSATVNGYTPLHYACWYGQQDVAQMLIDKDAIIDSTDCDNWNVFHFACLYYDDTMVRFLLCSNPEKLRTVDRNQKSTTGRTPLMVAIESGLHDSAKLLLENGEIDLSLRNDEGDTALALAANRKQRHLIQLILESRTYFPGDVIEETICTAAPYELGQIEHALLTCLKEGPHEDGWFECIMNWAVVNGIVELMRECANNIQPTKEIKDSKATWLHLASKYGRQALIKDLVDWKIDVSATTAQGMTALHLAAEGGHIITVQNLMSSIGRQNSGTQHPQKNTPPAGQCLSELILKETPMGDTAISLAGKRNHREISDIIWNELDRIFKDKDKCPPDSFPEDGQLVELAAQYATPGKEDMVKLLLEKCEGRKSDPDKIHWTALHWAVLMSRGVPVWWLLSNGAHLKSREIALALEIVPKKTDSIGQLIQDLLQNPPMIGAPPAIQDTYHLPQLPEWTGKDLDEFDKQSTIVDFFCQDNGVAFQLKRRPMKRMIYESNEGPSAIMKLNEVSNFNDFAEFKKRYDQCTENPAATTDHPISNVNRVVKAPKPDSMSPAAMKQSNKAPAGPGELQSKQSDTKKLKGEKETRKQRDFRWIHVPATCRKVIEHLMTRIAIDSKKTQQELDTILGRLKRSWIEVPAGGGKRFLQPQYQETSDGSRSNKNDQTASGKAAEGDTKPDAQKGTETTQQSKQDAEGPATPKKRLISLYIPFLTVSKGNSIEGRSTHADSQTHKAYCLHETMTLHQYYYATIQNTRDRDSRQVLPTYLQWKLHQESPKEHHPQEYKVKEALKETKDKQGQLLPCPRALTSEDKQIDSSIYTVDQLWLWIIDEDTIVTATTNGSDELIDAILDHLATDRSGDEVQRPKSATDMMELIVGIATDPSLQRVSTTIDKHSSVGQKDALQVFQESIRYVIDTEAQISQDFIEAVKKNHRQRLPQRDFGEEFDLLYRIKEIRDELSILKGLSSSQQTVWNRAFRTKNKKTNPLLKYPHPHEPSAVQTDLDDMMREATSAQDSINLFLDLKEKYTASQDADFGRQQAYTTMVFTIVTIVFLPLTFLSSVFALNVTDFPQGPSGRPQYHGWWIFPLIFGPSAAVSIPLIIVAFNVNDFIVTPYYRWKNGENHASRNKSSPALDDNPRSVHSRWPYFRSQDRLPTWDRSMPSENIEEKSTGSLV